MFCTLFKRPSTRAFVGDACFASSVRFSPAIAACPQENARLLAISQTTTILNLDSDSGLGFDFHSSRIMQGKNPQIINAPISPLSSAH